MKRALIELTAIAKQDKNVILLTGDLGYNLFDDFRMACPNQFINVGIMEQNMIGVAAGMSKRGKNVFVYSIGNFPSLRCLEQIRNEICYHDSNVKIIESGAGLNYGALGFTHHAINDLSCLQSLPDLTIFNPGDVPEAKACLWAAYRNSHPCFIRIGRTAAPDGTVIRKTLTLEDLEEHEPLINGKSIAILSSGPILYESYIVAKKMNASLFSFPVETPIKKQTIYKIAQKFPFLVTIEEDAVIGGFGSQVSQIVAENPKGARVLNVGIPVAADYTIGDHQYLKDHFGLSPEKIENQIGRFINE